MKESGQNFTFLAVKVLQFQTMFLAGMGGDDTDRSIIPKLLRHKASVFSRTHEAVSELALKDYESPWTWPNI